MNSRFSPLNALPLKDMVVLTPHAHAAGQHPDWEAFAESGRTALGFLLDAASGEQQDEWLWAIRSSPRWWNCWVALAQTAPASRLESLSDARQSLEQAAQSALALQAQDESHEPLSLDFEERLLHFLFVRDGALLQPVADRHSHYLYRYPLAEALGADEFRVMRTLLDLQRRRFLEPGQPLDRVRHCRKCSSAHPHYYDVCPSCRSIQIDKASAFHCFTCGHVSPQEDFMQDGRLVCPQCHAALRHIGVDYDRPMTQYVCRDCHHSFMEAAVQVRCLDCNDVSEAGELDVRTVAPLRLTALGRAALREGLLAEHTQSEGQAQNMPFAGFKQALAWTLATGGSPGSSLFVLDFDPRHADERFAPGERAQTHAQEAVRRVHEWLGRSDLSAVDKARRLWVMAADGAALAGHVQATFTQPSTVRVVRVDLQARPGAAQDVSQLLAHVERELTP